MVSSVAPELDYSYLPDQPDNPLMESTIHSRWGAILTGAIRRTLADAGTNALVTGNVPFVPIPGGAHTAPDLMVVPGMHGKEFGRYEVGVHGPAPLVCLEITSPGISKTRLDRRLKRWLDGGVHEVYQLDPIPETIQRVELVDDELVRTNAVGTYSPGLNVSFAVTSGRLTLCCPGGRTVGVDDDSYLWLTQEQRRADIAEFRAKDEQVRADAEQARADEQQARAQSEQARADEQQARADEQQARAQSEQARADEERARANAAQAKANAAEARAAAAEAELARLRRGS